MTMDKEIILAIITNMGAGLACIIVGFFALVAFLASLRWARKDDYRRGKEEARREGLENIQVTLARLVSDSEKNRGTYIE